MRFHIYSLFNILNTYNQHYYFCLPARVFTVYCLISIELTTVIIARGCDGCSILSGDSVGKSCPYGQDFLIHSLQSGKRAIPFPLRGWCPKIPPAKVMSNGKMVNIPVNDAFLQALSEGFLIATSLNFCISTVWVSISNLLSTFVVQQLEATRLA